MLRYASHSWEEVVRVGNSGGLSILMEPYYRVETLWAAVRLGRQLLAGGIYPMFFNRQSASAHSVRCGENY